MRIPCSIYRGGTSKPIFFLEGDLPEDRDPVVLRAFGSPDRRQVDGIGGGDPLTSKVAYVKKSNRPDADVDPEGDVLGVLDELRHVAGDLMGIGYSPGYPKAAIVGPSAEFDLVARATALDRWHRAYAVSGAICTAAAAKIPGTVVHEVARDRGPRVSIGHPSGSMVAEVTFEDGVLKKGAVERTARLLMEGEVVIP